MKPEETIQFYKKMYVNMVDLASHAVRGSETEKSATECMQHIEKTIEALEKQIPKEPTYSKIYDVSQCPNCKEKLKDEHVPIKNVLYKKHCPNCGQAIKWGD